MGQVSEQNIGLYTSSFGRVDEFNRGSHFKCNFLELTILDYSPCILQVCSLKKD